MDVIGSVSAGSGHGQVVGEEARFDMAFAHVQDPGAQEEGDERHGERTALWD